MHFLQVAILRLEHKLGLLLLFHIHCLVLHCVCMRCYQYPQFLHPNYWWRVCKSSPSSNIGCLKIPLPEEFSSIWMPQDIPLPDELFSISCTLQLIIIIRLHIWHSWMNFCSPFVKRAHIQIEYFFMLYRNMGTSALIQVFMLGTEILGTTKHVTQ